MQRVYFTCQSCREGEYAGDHHLGVEGSQTRQARRLLCLAGSSWSFAGASNHLKEFCGLVVAANTVRKTCYEESGLIEGWQANDPAASQSFRQAPGETEFTTDGTCVNTTEGWKEMRVGIFAKRPAGAAAQPSEWARRRLPPPSARQAFAAIESSAVFSQRWPLVAGRLGLASRDPLTVTADGARWIWDRVETYWPQADSTLDVFHALEHVSDTAKSLFGEGTEQTQQWNEQARDSLIAKGWPGIERVLNQTQPLAVRGEQRRALQSLTGYLGHQRNRLNYAQRLAAGRPIGSGMVEGACKHLIGRRMKQTGARWRIGNTGRMANLCSLQYSNNWKDYWDKN